MEISSQFVQSLREQARVFSAYRVAGQAVIAEVLGWDVDRVWIGGAESQFSPGRRGGVEIRSDDQDTALERAFIMAAAGRYLDSMTMEMEDDCGWEHLFSQERADAQMRFFSREIDNRWATVGAVAGALLEGGVLTGADVARLMHESDV